MLEALAGYWTLPSLGSWLGTSFASGKENCLLIRLSSRSTHVLKVHTLRSVHTVPTPSNAHGPVQGILLFPSRTCPNRICGCAHLLYSLYHTVILHVSVFSRRLEGVGKVSFILVASEPEQAG